MKLLDQERESLQTIFTEKFSLKAFAEYTNVDGIRLIATDGDRYPESGFQTSSLVQVTLLTLLKFMNEIHFSLKSK